MAPTPESRPPTMAEHDAHRGIPWLVFSMAVCLRALVGLQPHSGQDDHHGARAAYGGDFEAQRHWMELTLHLPIGDWYYYDLEYWGLDYPPITAYISYLCGLGSHHLVGPETVALETSRGIEDRKHKAYMRATVLVLDLIIYGYALWISLDRHRHGYRGEYGEQQHQKHHPRHHAQQQQKENQERWQTRLTSTSMWLLLLALVQPAIVLIDHGHFQYNTVALGWSLMAFHFMTKGNFRQCVVGAFFFCLALNFKQMTLYYAPVVFAYLLGRCFADTTRFTVRFASLGITVITTFLVMWLPFLINGPSHVQTSVPERAVQILTRIFPFQRGLFESKVANLWCALSTKPFSIRERIAAEMQPLLALGLTTVLMLPSCVALFRMGAAKTTSDLQRQRKDATSLLWGATSCSLAFFLASFQVHEKSILMALAPASLLMDLDASFVQFLSVACAWSLWPLLQVDRLEVAYVCTVLIYICVVWMYHQQQDGAASEMQRSFFSSFFRSIPILAYIGMLGLHAMQLCVEAPQGLPDLYPVLWSIAGCGLFLVAWLCTLWHLFTKQAAAKQKVS